MTEVVVAVYHTARAAEAAMADLEVAGVPTRRRSRKLSSTGLPSDCDWTCVAFSSQNLDIVRSGLSKNAEIIPNCLRTGASGATARGFPPG